MVVSIQTGQPVSLGFDQDSVEVLQNDTDIVILFADGGQITLQSILADTDLDLPPLVLLNDGRLLTAQEFLDLRGGNEALAEALSDIAPEAGAEIVPLQTNSNEGEIDTTPLSGPNDGPASCQRLCNAVQYS